MRNLATNKRGQFIIIAALLVALMMISISPLLHEAATYYTHEPWEEYLSLMGGLELNSERLMEISLANHVQSANLDCLDNNLKEWQTDLSQMYTGKGIFLSYNLTNEPKSLAGISIPYTKGLSYLSDHNSSYSSADAQFILNISSIGLKGYCYNVTILLKLDITAVNASDATINATITQEDGLPINGLDIDSFYVMDSTSQIGITSVKGVYDPIDTLIYIIQCDQTTLSNPISLRVTDQRGLETTAIWP